MKGNKYLYDEDDLYDDDYYDDYEEEDIKPKPKKSQATNQKNISANTQAGKKTNNNTDSSTAKSVQGKGQPAAIKSQPAANKSQSMGTTISSGKTQSDKEKLTTATDPSKINLEPTIKQIEKTHLTEYQTKKTKSIPELNSTKYPKIDYKLDSDSNISSKQDINIVIIGHVDSGKSTLMGHLLYLQGEISDKTLQKYEKESRKIGKNTFHFAWAMDEGTEERKRGVTVDIAYKNFETSKKKVSAMDAPGHRDFIPNMITGTSAADCAILVIDSNKNAFEAGFFLGGQTKEHAVLARSLGVKQIIICVNKLELMDWSKDRFEYIEAQVRDYLNSLDYNDQDIFFVPVSGLKGTNLVEVDKNTTQLQWYEGRSLVEIIDSLEDPIRDTEAPVRFSIADCGPTTINSLQGIGVFGKLQTGVITDDSEYVIMPANIKIKIRSMTVDNKKSSVLKAGQSGELLLVIDKSLADDIFPGNILCSLDHPVPVINEIRAQIMTLDIKAPLNIGQMLFVHCLSQKSQAKIKKIEKIFSKDGKTTKKNTVFIPKNFNAFVILEFEGKMCLEIYSNIKSLGRITLRASGETLAAGVVSEFLA